MRDVGVLPCAWNRTSGECEWEQPPTLALSDHHPSAASVEADFAKCAKYGFIYQYHPRIHFRGGDLRLAPSSDTDLLILVDEWGIGSIGHATHDNLFPIAATARLLLGVALTSIAASAAGARVRVYVLSSGGLRGTRASKPVAWGYVGGMQEAILGQRLQPASEIVPARYARIALGSFKGAIPVLPAAIDAYRVRREEHARLLWAEFHHVLRARVFAGAPVAASAAAARAQPYGVWFRRSSSSSTSGAFAAQRLWSPAHFQVLQDAACNDTDAAGAATAGTAARAQGPCWLVAQNPADLSFREQAELMRNAQLASGFEGSAFVNTLFMPAGGLLFEFDTWQRGNIGFSWGHAQYIHGHLVSVISFLPLSRAVATAVGRILRTAWHHGTDGVCERYQNSSSFVILVHPPCGPPAENAKRERIMHFHGTWCRCLLTLSNRNDTVPARSQKALPPLEYPDVSLKARARWELATAVSRGRDAP